MSLQPSEAGVVFPDYRGVRRRALAEVDPTVGSHDGTVGMMVPHAGKAVRDRRDLSVRGDAEDPAALERASFGHVEDPLVSDDAVPGAVFSAPAHDHARAAPRFDAQKARRVGDLAIGVARLDDVDPARIVE